MLKTSVFKIQINCPGCNMYHTITSLDNDQVCQNCGKFINMEYFFRSNMFGAADIEKYMNAFLSGNVEQIGGSGGVGNTGSYRLSYSSLQTYCEECLLPVEEKEILSAINEKRPVKCPECSHIMPIKPADDSILKLHRKAIAVVNDSTGYDSRDKIADKDVIIVFSCMSCGAGLELHKNTQRSIKCSFCGNENYLPDMIWTKLHPNKEVSPLFVLLDVDGKDMKESVDYFTAVTAMMIYDKHFENFIREYFEKPFETDALNTWFTHLLNAENDKSGYNIDIEKIQQSLFNQLLLGYENHKVRLREVAAGNGRKIPIDLQHKMAADSEIKVRSALASNPNINKIIRHKLQNDSEPEVSVAAKKHKTGFFGKLFG